MHQKQTNSVQDAVFLLTVQSRLKTWLTEMLNVSQDSFWHVLKLSNTLTATITRLFEISNSRVNFDLEVWTPGDVGSVKMTHHEELIQLVGSVGENV